MKRFLLLPLLLLPLAAQNSFRAVPTVADLVAADPRTFAASPLNGGSSFTAAVRTTGDAVAGDGARDWIWVGGSSAATNAACHAWPYGAATGRWVQVTQASPVLLNPDFGGTIEVLPGASLVATNTASLTLHTVFLTKPTASAAANEPTRKDYVDTLFASVTAGSSEISVRNTMADLVTLAASTNNPGAVFLKGYWGGTNIGFGSGIWVLEPSSTYPTNRAVIAASTGGRYMPYFPLGQIDITRFGMIREVTDDIGIHDAMAMQQDRTNYPAGGRLWVPLGVWQFTTSLTNNYVTTSGGLVTYPNRLMISGDGRGIDISTPSGGTEIDRYRRASTLKMMSANTPIIQLGGYGNEVNNLAFDFAANQSHDAGYTNGVCVRVPIEAGPVSRSIFENLSGSQRIYRLIDVPLSGGRTFWNNSLNRLYTRGCYGGAVHLGRAGTPNDGQQWYLQGYNFPVGGNNAATVDHTVQPTLSGTNLTFTLLATANNWVTSMTNGTFVELSGYSGFSDMSRFVTSVGFVGIPGSNTLTIALTPGEAAAISPTPPMPASGMSVACNNTGDSDSPMFYNACEISLQAVDIELRRLPTTIGNRGGVIENAGRLRIDQLHLEAFHPRVNNQVLVRNFGGQLHIGEVEMTNFSLDPALTVYGLKNESTTHGGTNTYWGTLWVGSVGMKDMYAGGNFILNAPPVGIAPTNQVDRIVHQVNQRVAGWGGWPSGGATRSTLQLWP